jgi:hypothetical protein
MSLRKLLGCSIAAIGGVAMLASVSPASAFTLSGPALDRHVPAQVENAFWRGGGWHGGWRGRGWGWGPGAVVGGLAAGALVGGYYGGYYGPYANGPYYGYGNCWRDGWGRVRCY